MRYFYIIFLRESGAGAPLSLDLKKVVPVREHTDIALSALDLHVVVL